MQARWWSRRMCTHLLLWELQNHNSLLNNRQQEKIPHLQGQRSSPCKMVGGLPQDWGNRLLEGTKKNLCAPGARSKEQWPHKRLTQTFLWVSRSLQWRHWSVVACHRLRGMGPFEGGHHYLHYLHRSLVTGQQQGGTQLRPSTENWIRDLLSFPPPIRTRPSFPHSQSLQLGSFHKPLKPLILIPQRADRMKTTITEN